MQPYIICHALLRGACEIQPLAGGIQREIAVHGVACAEVAVAGAVDDEQRARIEISFWQPPEHWVVLIVGEVVLREHYRLFGNILQLHPVIIFAVWLAVV